MRRPAMWILTGTLGLVVALTLGPLPRRALALVTDVVSLTTGLPSAQLRPPVEAVSNVLMFAVLAAALLTAVPRMSAALVVALLASASVAVEIVQGVVLVGRYAEPRDVLLNTAGALLGAGAVTLVRSRRAAKAP